MERKDRVLPDSSKILSGSVYWVTESLIFLSLLNTVNLRIIFIKNVDFTSIYEFSIWANCWIWLFITYDILGVAPLELIKNHWSWLFLLAFHFLLNLYKSNLLLLWEYNWRILIVFKITLFGIDLRFKQRNLLQGQPVLCILLGLLNSLTYSELFSEVRCQVFIILFVTLFTVSSYWILILLILVFNTT